MYNQKKLEVGLRKGSICLLVAFFQDIWGCGNPSALQSTLASLP